MSCSLFLRCLDDVDDEVRDRAAMYLRLMKEESLANALVKDGMYGTFGAHQTRTDDRLHL
jgi:coatomer protein complex subunit gamma